MGYHRALIVCILLPLFLSACTSENTEEVQDTPASVLEFTGNGVKETDNYYFKNRERGTVDVFFYEPFLSAPQVEETNARLEYEISEISPWGFRMQILGTGFWRDTTFKVIGTPANGERFCFDTDKGNSSVVGGKVYSLNGIFQDVCVSGTNNFLEEQYCQNNTLQSTIIQCENSCFSENGPAVCVNGTNVLQDCHDPIPGNNFFTRDYVSYNGVEYYDYCLGQIHGTIKELAEYVCDGPELKELNHFCDLGCEGGRCVTQENLIVPQLTYGIITDGNKIGDMIDFKIFATDESGLKSVILYEQNTSMERVIVHTDCNGKNCNSSIRMKAQKEGFFIYRAVATNIYNNSAIQNLTLNFSSDLSGPVINMSVSPVRFNTTSFTYISVNITDNKGLRYFALYNQPFNGENELLSTWSCRERKTCEQRIKLGFNDTGFYTLMVTAVDTDFNSDLFTRAIEVFEVNETPDTVAPTLTFTIDTEKTFIGQYITVDYKVTDDIQLSRITFYKKDDGEEDWSYVSGLECSNATLCGGDFIYKYDKVGDVEYMINATDAGANYDFKILSVEYEPEPNTTREDITPPTISFIPSLYEQGTINKTLITYSASDLNALTYMNLYEQIGGEFQLIRTRFCQKQTTCEASLVHEQVKKNTTFLVVAVDVYGNKGEHKTSLAPDD